MLRLLSIEFHKLKNNKAAKVLSLIYFLLFSAIALFASIRFNFLTSGISTPISWLF
jgi:ABC-2 type transport system permease protein